MISREDVIRMAREAGFVASVGRTDKEGHYHPNVNALGRHVPVEWLEQFAERVLEQAKKVAKHTCHRESTFYGNGYNQAAIDIEHAIEALKAGK